MLVSTTTEMIEKLQDYERRNGVGAIRAISLCGSMKRENNFILFVSNQSMASEMEQLDKDYLQEERIEISAIDDELLFQRKV